jgi:hypothetical protein
VIGANVELVIAFSSPVVSPLESCGFLFLIRLAVFIFLSPTFCQYDRQYRRLTRLYLLLSSKSTAKFFGVSGGQPRHLRDRRCITVSAFHTTISRESISTRLFMPSISHNGAKVRLRREFCDLLARPSKGSWRSEARAKN